MSASIDPIDYGIRLEDNRLGHCAAVGLTAVFLLAISLPGLLREFSADAIRTTLAQLGHWHDGTVVDRLRSAEKRIDEGAWTKPIRQQVQTVLYRAFREGNRKVLVGRDGWLFHRPGIRALTGRGPVLGPTHSVAKDHTLKSWGGPGPVIQEFAAQLKERGIQFVLVPVPDKAANDIEHLSSFFTTMLAERAHDIHMRVLQESTTDFRWKLGSPVFRWLRYLAGPYGHPRHPDSESFFAGLKDCLFVCSLQPSAPYLRSDTHWNGRQLDRLSGLLSEEVGFLTGHGSNKASIEGVVESTVEGIGDLAASLNPQPKVMLDFKEIAQGRRTTPATSDPTSPIVLLGDSNVNMYDDPSLPFFMPGAGFGSWMSVYLGRSLHIIAINGGGATAVRRQFAALPDDVVRAKQLVIWVIAERDLFMDPAVARENGVEWKRVVFNPNQSQPADAVPGDAIVVEVTLKAKSALQDLAQANYPDAVYVAECTVDKVVTGTYAPSELAVVLWNFRNRQVHPSATYSPGQKLRLTLVTWDSKGDLTKTNRSDDFLRFDLPLLYAEKIEPR